MSRAFEIYEYIENAMLNVKLTNFHRVLIIMNNDNVVNLGTTN